MKVIFDPQADTLSIILRDEKVSESDEVIEGIIFDYSKNGKVVSIGIMDASEQVTEPQCIFFGVSTKQGDFA